MKVFIIDLFLNFVRKYLYLVLALNSMLIFAAPNDVYPARPIRLIVAVQPGGNLDMVGRAVAEKISEGLGQRILVENRPGANSTIGLSAMARAVPDGYTFAMIAQSALVAPRMMRNPPYDPIRDFSAVSLIATVPQMLVVHPSLPVHSVKELIAFAKVRPGKLNCGSSGNGSGSHLALELFNKLAKVSIVRIPYNGDSQAITELLGGQVPIKFDNLSTSLPYVRLGRLRPLGVTTPVRSVLLPDIPAISEMLPGYQMSVFNGMVGPTLIHPDILVRIHSEIQRFTQSQDAKQRFAMLGVELQASPSPAHFSNFIKSEYISLSKVLDDAGIKPE